MKNYTFLIFLFFCNFSFSQTDDIKYISFDINYPNDTQGLEDIDFTKEKPECTFELKGKINLKYSFRLQNDSTASLYQFRNSDFEFQENLDYQPVYWHVDNNVIFSSFKIIDFDNDGDEDLLCWVNSNVNTNEWTVIFINDQKQQKLVRLINTADETDIWDKPEFDKNTNIINTELYGSAFGVSEESSYKLENDLTITPLQKHFQDRTKKRMYDYFYVGQNGKWKLKSKKRVKN